MREAIERGDFDDNPLAGKPLEIEDLSHVPEEMRASLILLKNAGFVPEEIGLRGEIVRLRDLLDAVTDDEETRRLRDDLNAAELRYEMLCARRGLPVDYRAQVLDKLSRRPDEQS